MDINKPLTECELNNFDKIMKPVIQDYPVSQISLDEAANETIERFKNELKKYFIILIMGFLYKEKFLA